MRVHIGTLEFHGCAGIGFSGFFETASFRVIVQHGTESPNRWIDDGPVTGQQAMKFTRVVSEKGQYTARVICEFGDAFDLPRPADCESELLVADVWVERKTLFEHMDSILDTVGLGNNFPEFDRRWLGRAMVSLPEEGVDSISRPWAVLVDSSLDGPIPKTLSVGIEWVADDHDSD